MKALLAASVFCVLTVRAVEASLGTGHPINILAPDSIASFGVCLVSLLYMFRKDS
jgi:hypothetical protein